MLFAEEMNHQYYAPITFGGNPSALPPSDVISPWKHVGEYNPIYNVSNNRIL